MKKVWPWNEGQGIEERNLRHSTGNIRIHIGDFLKILAAYVYAEGNKHTTREGVMTIVKNLQSRFA